MATEIKIPKGYRLIRESKSERVQLLVRPATMKRLRKRAEEQDISVNELCNRLFDNYVFN